MICLWELALGAVGGEWSLIMSFSKLWIVKVGVFVFLGVTWVPKKLWIVKIGVFVFLGVTWGLN